MAYKVEIDRQVQKFLRALSRAAPRDCERIEDAIDALRETPRPPGVKRLRTRGPGFRIRVGDYRILFAVFDTDELVKVSLIARRGERTYQDIDRLFGD